MLDDKSKIKKSNQRDFKKDNLKSKNINLLPEDLRKSENTEHTKKGNQIKVKYTRPEKVVKSKKSIFSSLAKNLHDWQERRAGNRKSKLADVKLSKNNKNKDKIKKTSPLQQLYAKPVKQNILSFNIKAKKNKKQIVVKSVKHDNKKQIVVKSVKHDDKTNKDGKQEIIKKLNQEIKTDFLKESDDHAVAKSAADIKSSLPKIELKKQGWLAYLSGLLSHYEWRKNKKDSHGKPQKIKIKKRQENYKDHVKKSHDAVNLVGKKVIKPVADVKKDNKKSDHKQLNLKKLSKDLKQEDPMPPSSEGVLARIDKHLQEIHPANKEASVGGEGFSVNLIPEDLAAEVNVKRIKNVLLLTSLFSILVVITAFTVIHWQQLERVKQAQEIKRQTRETQDELISKSEDLQTMIAYQKSYDRIKTLMDAHIYWTPLFTFLEENVVDGVYFHTMSADRNGLILVSIEAEDYIALAQQYLVFKSAPGVVTVKMDGISLETSSNESLQPEIENLNELSEEELAELSDEFIKNFTPVDPRQRILEAYQNAAIKTNIVIQVQTDLFTKTEEEAEQELLMVQEYEKSEVDTKSINDGSKIIDDNSENLDENLDLGL